MVATLANLGLVEDLPAWPAAGAHPSRPHRCSVEGDGVLRRRNVAQTLAHHGHARATFAVVVRRRRTSLVLVAILGQLRAHVLVGICELDTFGIVKPSLVMVGSAPLLCR